jgi:hypothetical protein
MHIPGRQAAHNPEVTPVVPLVPNPRWIQLLDLMKELDPWSQL